MPENRIDSEKSAAIVKLSIRAPLLDPKWFFGKNTGSSSESLSAFVMWIRELLSKDMTFVKNPGCFISTRKPLSTPHSITRQSTFRRRLR